MSRLFLIFLVVTALHLCSSRPNGSKSKKYVGRCLNKMGQNPRKPIFKMVNLYDNVTLKCPLKAKHPTFLKNCYPIKQSKTKNIKISGNALTLTKFVTMDGGKYSCQGKLSDGTIKEVTWILHIKIKYPSGLSSTNKERPVNGAVMMDCRGSKAGKHLYYSHIKGKHLSKVSSNRVTGDKNSGIYELYDLTIDDTGYYYCGDIGKTGKWDLVSHLLVRELPVVEEKTGKTVAKPGDSVQFICKYRGPQTIAWYKDEKVVSGSNATQKNGLKVLKLTLNNVQAQSEGKYACGVTFDNNITVYQPIEFDIFYFTNLPVSYVYDSDLVIGSRVYVLCLSNQGDQAKYWLLKSPLVHSLQFTNAATLPGVFQVSSGYFIINSFSVKHEGFYRCAAEMRGLTIMKDIGDLWLS